MHDMHLVAEAILHDREAQRHRQRHLIHHLDEIRPRHPVRARLAAGLVRLARIVEPGAGARIVPDPTVATLPVAT